jgi:hypothetical protein
MNQVRMDRLRGFNNSMLMLKVDWPRRAPIINNNARLGLRPGSRRWRRGGSHWKIRFPANFPRSRLLVRDRSRNRLGVPIPLCRLWLAFVGKMLFNLADLVLFFRMSKVGQGGLCNRLRFEGGACRGFGIAQSGACLCSQHFAIAGGLGESRSHSRSSLRRAIAHAPLLVCADILLYNRDAPSILVRLDALVNFLLPRGLGYGLCAQLFNSLLSSS